MPKKKKVDVLPDDVLPEEETQLIEPLLDVITAEGNGNIPKVVKADIISGGHMPIQGIQIRDTENHLLFVYDVESHNIEIKVRSKTFKVNVDELKALGMRNWLNEKPVDFVDATVK